MKSGAITAKGSSRAVSRLADWLSGGAGWSHWLNSPQLKTTRPAFRAGSSLLIGKATVALCNPAWSISCCTGGGHDSRMAESATAKDSASAGGAAGAGIGGGFGAANGMEGGFGAANGMDGGFGAANGMEGGVGAFGAVEGTGAVPGGLVRGEEGFGADAGGLGIPVGSVGAGGGLVKVEAGGRGAEGRRPRVEGPEAGFGSLGAATGLGAGTGATGFGAGGGGGGGGATDGAASSASGAESTGLTAALALKDRCLPKMLVTLSGIAVTFCPGRRASSAGSMDARTCARGKLTSDLSSVALSAKVPGGAFCRNWPNGIFTAPNGNCASAARTGSAKVPPPGEATNAARLGGSAAKIGASGRWITSPGVPDSSIPAGAGAKAAGVSAAGGAWERAGAAGAAGGVGCVWAGAGGRLLRLGRFPKKVV